MKYGVRFSNGRWWVYEVDTNILQSFHSLEWFARRRAQKLNERGA